MTYPTRSRTQAQGTWRFLRSPWNHSSHKRNNQSAYMFVGDVSLLLTMHSVFLCNSVPVCVPLPSYILSVASRDVQGRFVQNIRTLFFHTMYSLFQINFWHCISWLICRKSRVVLVNIGRISGQEYAPFSILWYIWLSKLNLNRRHLLLMQGDLSWVN